MSKGQKQSLIALGAVVAIVALVLVVFPAIPGGFLSGASYGDVRGKGPDDVEDNSPDCGKNPYKFNAIEGQYERTFHSACFPVTQDQNEIDLHLQYWTGDE